MNPPIQQSILSPPQLAWLLLRHKRRRHAAAPIPNAPLITQATYDLDGTEPGWFDILLDFTFEHGTFPVATLQIWFALGTGEYTLLDTIPSTEVSYCHHQAEQGEDPLLYKLRYVNGPTIRPLQPPSPSQPPAPLTHQT